MANPYTQVTVANYNQTPPSDDGTVAASNQVNWSKHKTKLTDPLKTAIEAIDTNVNAAFQAVVDTPEVPHGHLSGFQMANSTADSDHDIRISPGVCRDYIEGNGDSSASLSRVASDGVLIKQIDADWVEGSAAGGFPSSLSLSIDTWYHVFVIGKSDGTVDAGFDTNLSAANLLADASDYSVYRRVGSVLTNATSNIIQFTQIGDQFWWDAPFNEYNQTNPGTNEVNVTVRVPALEKQITALVSVLLTDDTYGSPTYGLVRPSNVADTTPTATRNNISIYGQSAGPQSGRFYGAVHAESSVVTFKIDQSTADHTVVIATHGYIDDRGKSLPFASGT